MSARGRGLGDRVLALATAGLPAHRADWGAAMRAELAAIENADARRRFALSASVAAFTVGFGIRIAFAVGSAVVVAAVTWAASRAQLPVGGPGVLGVTIAIPAIPLLAVGFVTALRSRSFRFGLETGALALAASFGALFVALALEGQVWMERYGVFVLDGDPPRGAVGTAEVVFDLFSTGMWIGHLVFWLPWPVIGAGLGSRLGSRATR